MTPTPTLTPTITPTPTPTINAFVVALSEGCPAAVTLYSTMADVAADLANEPEFDDYEMQILATRMRRAAEYYEPLRRILLDEILPALVEAQNALDDFRRAAALARLVPTLTNVVNALLAKTAAEDALEDVASAINLYIERCRASGY